MRLILSCLLAVAACGGGDGDHGGGDDGANSSDAGASLDGAPSSSDAQASRGLTVSWAAQPPLPGPVSGATIASVKLKLARLEVIGDTGSPTGTTRNDFDVVWSAALMPVAINFLAAEPGLYSTVSLQIDGKVVAPSYEILGTVVINGTTESFRISDTAIIMVDINGFNVPLTAGGSGGVAIRVDLEDAIEVVDFVTLPVVGNVRTMDQDTPGIAAVRTSLETKTFLQ